MFKVRNRQVQAQNTHREKLAKSLLLPHLFYFPNKKLEIMRNTENNFDNFFVKKFKLRCYLFKMSRTVLYEDLHEHEDLYEQSTEKENDNYCPYCIQNTTFKCNARVLSLI